jgi:hypothetical protein
MTKGQNVMSINMTEEEMSHVAELLEQHIHDHAAARKAARKAHWKRRTVMLVVVLVVGYGTHILLEVPELRAAAQSCELLLASFIDSLFAKAREFE